MRVSIEIPETTSPTAVPAGSVDLTERHTQLLKAMERLLGVMQHAPASTNLPTDALLEAVRGLRQTIRTLPGELKEALHHQYQEFQQAHQASAMPPSPVTVVMPEAFLTRLDALEASLLEGLKHSRSRTFGSNN